MRISDWSSDVCSSDLLAERDLGHVLALVLGDPFLGDRLERVVLLDLGFRQRDLLLMRGVEPRRDQPARLLTPAARARISHRRSEEHTSELQSLMRIAYAVICLNQNISHNIKTRIIYDAYN